MDLNRHTIRKLLFLVVFAALIVWGLFHPSAILEIVQVVLTVLFPFLLGLSIAFLINLLLRPIEHRWDALLPSTNSKWLSKLKRPVCILLSTTLIAAVFFVLLFIVLPEVVRTTSSIIEMLPQYLAQVETWWVQLSETLLAHGVVLPQFDLDTSDLGTRLGSWLSEQGLAFFGKTVGITTSIFSWVFNVGLGLVFSLYVLAQKEQLGRQTRKMLHAFLSTEKANSVIEVAELTRSTFAKFVTGQLTESLIIGILCFLGMLVLSMPYAAPISVLVGATALIPVFGAFFGTAVGALLILMVDPMKALWFVVFVIVLQQFEGNVIYPRVVGKSVGLPGIWVLAAVTIGGSTFGIPGMLLSVPVSSVLYALLKTAVNRRLEAKQGS